MPAFLPPPLLPLPSRRPRSRTPQITSLTPAPSPARRSLLVAGAALAASAALPPADAFTFIASSEGANVGEGAPRRSAIRQGRGSGVTDKDAFTVYEVRNRADVTLVPLSLSEALDEIGDAKVNAVFFGEHHHSAVDRITQARIVDALHRANARRRPVAVGLEMVQVQFQGVLDAYVNREIDELELYSATEWESRWVWPFENYLPLFRVARKLGIPLLALSPDSEQLAKVRSADLADAAATFGGAKFERLATRDTGYQAYVNANILRSYASHARAHVLPGQPSFEKFYNTRIVRDEAMAKRCDDFLVENPGGLLVSVLGIDHVKFANFGVPGRLERRVADRNALRLAERAERGNAGTAGALREDLKEETVSVRSVILNPTAADAYNEDDGALMLDLPLGKSREPAKIADYLWFSSHIDVASRGRRGRAPPAARLPGIEELVDAQ